MKISELIELLKNIKEKHGDIRAVNSCVEELTIEVNITEIHDTKKTETTIFLSIE